MQNFLNTAFYGTNDYSTFLASLQQVINQLGCGGVFTGDNLLKQLVEREVNSRTGLTIDCGSALREFKHSVTRYRIRLLCFAAARKSGRLVKGQTFRWVSPTEFDDYPLSVTGRKLAVVLTQ